MQKKGLNKAMTAVTPQTNFIQLLEDLEYFLGATVEALEEKRTLPDVDCYTILKQRVQVALHELEDVE